MDVVSFSTESSKKPCGQMALMFQLIVLRTPTAVMGKLVKAMSVHAAKIQNAPAHRLVKMENVKKLIVIPLPVVAMPNAMFQTMLLHVNVSLDIMQSQLQMQDVVSKRLFLRQTRPMSRSTGEQNF